jgi:uncharacterized membrane protein
MRLIRLLKSELAHDAVGWVERGLVSREQAEAILDDYGAAWPDGSERSRGSLVLSALAALLVGLSALVLVGANWDAIPRLARLVGLVSLTGAAGVVGAHLWRAGKPLAARVALLLGALLYGAGIFLIGQMYHLGEHFPDGLFFWALGVAPMAFAVRSRMLACLAACLACGWMAMETFVTGFPILFLGFLAAQLFFLARVRRSQVLLMVTVVGAGLALNLFVVDLIERGGANDHAAVLYLSVVWFFAVYAVGVVLGRRRHPWARDYGTFLHVWTARFALVSLLPLAFEDPWRDLMRATQRLEGPWAWLCVGAAAGIAGALAGWARNAERRGREAVLLAAPALCWTSVFAAVTAFACWGSRDVGPWPVTAVTVALLGAGAWLVARGAQTGSATSFYLGVVATLVTAVCRYVDLVGDYLGTSLLFFLCGVALFAAARVWRSTIERGGSR